MKTKSEQKCHGGVQGFYEHESACTGGTMRFAVYLPERALRGERVCVVYFLAGLTCNEETFVIKAGAQRTANELGLALVTCDTSARSKRYPGDDEHWDFGVSAGFYLDATQAPWSETYRMETYVTQELRTEIERSFPVRNDRRALFGHSMGGHGAMVLALRNAGLYHSVSALAPIAAASEVPWGEKAFSRYLGDDRAAWRSHDACALLREHRIEGTLLVDVGTADKFLTRELQPERLEAACTSAGQPLQLQRHEGYDHSYYFVQTFVASHLQHHAKQLHQA